MNVWNFPSEKFIRCLDVRSSNGYPASVQNIVGNLESASMDLIFPFSNPILLWGSGSAVVPFYPFRLTEFYENNIFELCPIVTPNAFNLFI
jgi:hypothetical protein